MIKILGINEWLDKNGIDRAYKKDMRKTYEAIKGDLEAQNRDTLRQVINQLNGIYKQAGDIGELESQLRDYIQELQSEVKK